MNQRGDKRQRKVRPTKEQLAWIRNYKRETGFEALMDDFLAGNVTFLFAAHRSVKWFEDWANDAHLNIGRNIPGADA